MCCLYEHAVLPPSESVTNGLHAPVSEISCLFPRLSATCTVGWHSAGLFDHTLYDRGSFGDWALASPAKSLHYKDVTTLLNNMASV